VVTAPWFVCWLLSARDVVVLASARMLNGDETESQASFVPDESAVAAGAQDGYEDDLGYNLRPMSRKGGIVLLVLGCGVYSEFRAHDWPVLSL
jgi:hypothetical protein